MTKPAPASAVRERPLMFKAEMVQAILAGTKTQTRRIVTDRWLYGSMPVKAPQGTVAIREHGGLWHAFAADGFRYGGKGLRCPYGRPGERLWVRETHAIVPRTAYHHAASEIPHRLSPDGDSWAVYREGWTRCAPEPWRPSIHMHRWACRIVLELTDVRVERLQAISEPDARAEGVTADGRHGESYFPGIEHVVAYGHLWDEINGAGAWDLNPWVWVLTFRRVTP
jgi:hypothetical protein